MEDECEQHLHTTFHTSGDGNYSKVVLQEEEQLCPDISTPRIKNVHVTWRTVLTRPDKVHENECYEIGFVVVWMKPPWVHQLLQFLPLFAPSCGALQGSGGNAVSVGF